MTEPDVQGVWEEFWLPIVRDEGLAVYDMDQIKKELFDYHRLLQGLPAFFEDVTGGRVSKPNTNLQIVREITEQRLLDKYDEGFSDGHSEGFDEGYYQARSEIYD